MTPVPIPSKVPRTPRRVLVYVLTVTALGLLGLAWSIHGTPSVPYTATVILVGVLAAFTATSTLQIPGTSVWLNADTTFLVALVALGAGPEAVLLSGFNMAAATFSSGIWRQYPRTIPFNTAAGILGGVGAVACYYGAAAFIPQPVPVLFAGFGMFAVNCIAVAGIVFFDKGKLPGKDWRDGLKMTAVGYLASGSLAAVIAQMSIWQLIVAAPVPWVIWQLYSTYQAHKQEQAARVLEREQVFLPTLEALVAAIEARDERTHGHNRRIRALSLGLAKHLGITDQEQLTAIGYGALLHDVGKIAIPDALLRATRKLAPDELERVRKHVLIGADLVRHVPFPKGVLEVVRHHHERWDGTGYPDRLKADEIPLAARLMAVCEAYDDQRTGGGWRPPLGHEETLANLLAEAGTAFEPTVVRAFVAWQANSPVSPDNEPLPWTEAGQAIRESSREQARLHDLAFMDELTGVGNVRALREDLERFCAEGTRVGVLLLDMDGFKGINDHFGHHVGDQVLQEVGRALSAMEETGLRCYRKGGDEFVVLAPNADAAAVALLAADTTATLQSCRVPLTRRDYLPVRVSVGGISYQGASADEALQASDRAMYAVKESRREQRPRGSRPEVATSATPAPH